MELFCNACVTNVARPDPYEYDHDDNDDDGLLACGHEISNVFRCVWDDSSKEWLKVRRCPPDLKSGTKLSICHDKEAGDPCKRSDSCSFAHSKMEIKIWEIELRGNLLLLANLFTRRCSRFDEPQCLLRYLVHQYLQYGIKQRSFTLLVNDLENDDVKSSPELKYRRHCTFEKYSRLLKSPMVG